MMEFDIRPLRFKDVAPMARIVSQIGLREFKQVLTPEAIGAFAETVEDGQSVAEAVGAGVLIDAVGIVLENYDKAEDEIAAFLASVAGMKKTEVMELTLADSVALVKAVVAAQGFDDFLKQASALAR